MKFVVPPDKPTANFLIYGPAKTGKSLGAATAPGNLIYLNADLPNATRLVHRRNPDRIFEPELPAFEAGQHPVLGIMGEIATTVHDHERGNIGGVVVDPVGELHRRLLEEGSRRAVRPSINTYGDVSIHIERFCRHLCEAPVNAVIVCHDHPVKDEGTGEVERLPYTGTSNPALGQKLLGMVDVVAYTGAVAKEDGSVEYVAQVIPLKGRRGGDRFNVIPPLGPLNIAAWLAAIEEYEKSQAGQPAAQNSETPKEAVAA